MIPPHVPIIDVHTHLAGIGQNGSGCYIERKRFHSLLYKLLRYELGIYRADRDGRLDLAYAERLLRDVETAATQGALQAAVLFPHEKVYLENGLPHPSFQQVYTPNEWVFEWAARGRGRFLPAMSVHPYRRDALDECRKWIERGAVALKWLPNSQCMDPRDARCKPIFELLAREQVPLIAHTGGEHTVSVLRPELGDPDVLLPALDCGVHVIMAHCGTASGLFDRHWMPRFCELARAYPNCWGDTSAFNTPGRARWTPRILREEGVASKLIHGSDYPVPPVAWWSLWRLGLSETRRLQRIWSFLQRDVAIKRALGFPDEVFTNAARVLRPGSLERWGIIGAEVHARVAARTG